MLCIFNNSAAHTLRAAALLAVSAALLCGCQGGFSIKETEAKRISADIPQTGNTKIIPEKYFQKAKKQGRVIDFTYETAEYAQKSQMLILLLQLRKQVLQQLKKLQIQDQTL